MYSGTSYASGNPYVLGGYRASPTPPVTANPYVSSPIPPLPSSSSASAEHTTTTTTCMSPLPSTASSTTTSSNASPSLYGGVGLLSVGERKPSSGSSSGSNDGSSCASPSPLEPPSPLLIPSRSATASPDLSSPYSTFVSTNNNNATSTAASPKQAAASSSSSSPSGCNNLSPTNRNTNYQRSSLGPHGAAGRKRGQGAGGGGPSANNSIKVEVVETDMAPGADGPIYHIKLDMNGRAYVAARHHNKLRSLVEDLRTRGYRILRPFPEVEDMVQQAPVKVENSLVEALPFYEGFGYSIKSLASTMLKSTSAAHLRKKRSLQLEQMSQRIDTFLKTIFLENDDLQYEQEVYHFFWEPLQKKLPPVLEEETSFDTEEEGEEEEVEVDLDVATKMTTSTMAGMRL